MTRDEFVDGYMARSGIPASARTPEGFATVGLVMRARPCRCGEEGCWSMDFASKFETVPPADSAAKQPLDSPGFGSYTLLRRNDGTGAPGISEKLD